MKQSLRDRFDRQVERVLAGMPPLVHQLLERIPLHVEDHPPRDVMEEKGVVDLDELCGLFTGVSLPDKSVEDPPHLRHSVTIYRLGILAAASDDHGHVSADRLREEIRITILHELAHFLGLDEEELEQLGYG